MIAKSVFDALGADTVVIGNKPDGLNINVDCGSTHLAALQKLVQENGLDVGFAFDGDADRCLAVDENGDDVSGDEIMYMCARHMAERGRLDNNTLVTTVMSNFGLYKALDEVGIKYEKTAVGDKYVWENMRANGHLIGGEQSGHIIFSKYATTGDGLITAIKVMQVMLDTQAAAQQAGRARDHIPAGAQERHCGRQGRHDGRRRRAGERREGRGRARRHGPRAAAQERHGARAARHGRGRDGRALRGRGGRDNRRHAYKRAPCEGEMMYTIEDLLDLSHTIAAGLFEGKTYPWEALADIKGFILALGPDAPGGGVRPPGRGRLDSEGRRRSSPRPI